MIRLLQVLYKIGLLSPVGILRLLAAICRHGFNPMALLAFASKSSSGKIIDDHSETKFSELLTQGKNLANVLRQEYKVTPGQKIGFLCNNHISLVTAIIAVSRLGADIYLLNTQMSSGQLQEIYLAYDFHLIIHDQGLSPLVQTYNKTKILSFHKTKPAINNLAKTHKFQLPRTGKSKIVLLTGGTTGKPKSAEHNPSVFNFLNPLCALLDRLNLPEYERGYIATPIYHGYGVSFLFLFILLGKTIVISNKFEAGKAWALISKHNIQVVTVVPLMLRRMLDSNTKALDSLACIVSGSAELDPQLVEQTFNQLGDVLYNLYGTSETGLLTIATPKDLRCSPGTVGLPVQGAKLRILDEGTQTKTNQIGQICVKNAWSMGNRKNAWLETGDLGYRDDDGYYFLRGRTDSMIVSAGVNVYPLELEQVLISHPNVVDVAVVGVEDEQFGQRLRAYIVSNGLSEAEFVAWLRPKVARYLMPREIVFVPQLPYTALGKLDKKVLNLEMKWGDQYGR